MLKKKIKPITPSQRHLITFKNTNLSNKLKIKKLIKGFHRANGRNNQGRITCQHKGGGHKRLYRHVNFNTKNISGYIKGFIYDPNRTSFLTCIENKNKQYIYCLAVEGLSVGNYIESSDTADIQTGNSLPLKNIPLGSIIHNISLYSNKGGQLVRSAGTCAQLAQKINNKYAKIKLMSGEFKIIPLNCFATLGTVANLNHKKKKLGKAGRSRWLNKRPTVRGVAKNPVDHPHGGGEGKTSGGRPSVTPFGRITKGKPTVKCKNKKKCR